METLDAPRQSQEVRDLHLRHEPQDRGVICVPSYASRICGGRRTEDKAREALTQLDPLWDELFPAEEARIVQLCSSGSTCV